MDDVDFSTLAARTTAGLDGVRACLILSSDGLTMGVYPESGEARAREAWDRLQDLGDPQRGFVDIGEELWVFVRGGAYAGVLLTRPGVRPGFLIDKLEFLLRAAEEARTREAAEINAASSARPEATRRPRTSLHAESKQAPPAPARPPAPPPAPGPARASADRSPGYKPPPVLSGAAKKVVDVTAERGDGSDTSNDIDAPPALELGPASESLSEAAREVDELARPDRPPVAASAPSSTEPAPSAPTRRTSAPRPAAPPSSSPPAVAGTAAPDAAARPSASPDPEVDRVAMAREFGRLLAEGGAGGDR